jgi:hypothetical protein
MYYVHLVDRQMVTRIKVQQMNAVMFPQSNARIETLNIINVKRMITASSG